MMEIPSGQVCDRCPFFKDSYEDMDATCGMFEDKKMSQEKYYFGETLTWWRETTGYARADRCLSAYPYGGTVEIKAKEVK